MARYARIRESAYKKSHPKGTAKGLASFRSAHIRRASAQYKKAVAKARRRSSAVGKKKGVWAGIAHAKRYGVSIVSKARRAAKRAKAKVIKLATKRKSRVYRPVAVAAKTARKPKGKGGKKMTKADRSRAAKKGWARRRRTGKTPKKSRKVYRRRRHTQAFYFKKYKEALHKRRPKTRAARSIHAARRTILRTKARRWRKGQAGASRLLRKYRMSSNPKGTLKGVVETFKQVVPVAIAFVGARVGTKKLAALLVGKVSALANYTQHVEPVVSVAFVAAAHIASLKVAPLRKYRTGLMVGTGLNALTTIASAYGGEKVKALLGMGDSDGVYDSVLGAYEDVGDYVETGDYLEDNGVGDYIATQDYVEMGTDDDLGAYEEVGACGAYEDLGAFANKRQLKQLSAGRRGRRARVPSGNAPARRVPKQRSAVEIPDWGDEPLESFYTGVFAGGFGS